jgi:hypothetical protein
VTGSRGRRLRLADTDPVADLASAITEGLAYQDDACYLVERFDQAPHELHVWTQHGLMRVEVTQLTVESRGRV